VKERERDIYVHSLSAYNVFRTIDYAWLSNAAFELPFTDKLSCDFL